MSGKTDIDVLMGPSPLTLENSTVSVYRQRHMVTPFTWQHSFFDKKFTCLHSNVIASRNPPMTYPVTPIIWRARLKSISSPYFFKFKIWVKKSLKLSRLFLFPIKFATMPLTSTPFLLKIICLSLNLPIRVFHMKF